MAVLNVKDANRLETIRKWVATEPAYYAVFNRCVNDLEQRTNDLDAIMTPARGFRVRQTASPSTSVEVEAGNYVSGTSVVQLALTTIAPTAASLTNIRVNLIWLDLDAQTINEELGAEIPSGSGFAACVRPSLPANDGAVPLAYVYCDDTPTSFDRTIALNTAGHIEDIRPCLGQVPPLEDTVGNLVADSAAGLIGTSAKVPRSDHSHPLAVNDAWGPATLEFDKPAAPGGDTYYARRDHVHLISAYPFAGGVDTSGGSAGSSVLAPRGDHQHALNIDAVLPALISLTGAAGAANIYARRDHVHPFLSAAEHRTAMENRLKAEVHASALLEWNASSTPQNVVFSGFRPLFVVGLMTDHTGLAAYISAGFCDEALNQIGLHLSHTTGNMSVDEGRFLGTSIPGTGKNNFSAYLDVTAWPAPGAYSGLVTLTPGPGVISGKVILLFFGVK